jgi:hypothetical protein
MAVYQSERFGNSSYTFPNLSPGRQHNVRLHFAELYQAVAGKRKLDVAVTSRNRVRAGELPGCLALRNAG